MLGAAMENLAVVVGATESVAGRLLTRPDLVRCNAGGPPPARREPGVVEAPLVRPTTHRVT